MQYVQGKPKQALLLFFVSLLLCTVLFTPLVSQAAPNEKINQLIVVGMDAGGHVDSMHTAVENQYQHEGDASQHQWTLDLNAVSALISDNKEAAAKQAVCVWFGENMLTTKYDWSAYFDNSNIGSDSSAELDVITYNATGAGRAISGYDYTMEYSEEILVYDEDGNIVWAVEPTDDEEGVQATETRVWTEDVHVKGYAELWKEKGALVYAFALGPISKELGDAEDEKNAPVKAWNKTFGNNLKSNATFLDIYQDVYDHNPYYSSGLDYGTRYSDPMYCWIFHMMWNTILTLNPNDAPPEPIVQSFYSVSSSLTAYMNKVLSSSSDEVHNHHTLIEASTPYVGNAGAFLGYGDADYNWNGYITSALSKTSSVINYQALLGQENGTNERYLYARYGRLLADMGFDDTSTKLSMGSPRLIPGALMYLVYVLSSGVTKVFDMIFELLRLLNPFGFLANAHSISDELKSGMIAGSAGDVGGAGVSALSKILDVVGDAYDILYDMGAFILIPFFLVMLLANLLLRKTFVQERFSKIKGFLLRSVFILIGVPMMGGIYTAALSYCDFIASDAKAPSTQMVAATFLDFKGWAQNYRLHPIDGGVFVSSSTSESDSGAIAGEASAQTYKNLRKTAYLVNDATGAVDHVDMSRFGMGSLTDTSKWVIKGLTSDNNTNAAAMRECVGLIQSYMLGDFYTAGDWESDSMSTFTANHRDKVGRLAGGDEENPPDNKDTAYELFENTNETDDWMGRASDVNQTIFTNSGDYAGWNDFNIFANGRLTVSNLRADAGDMVTYSGTPVIDSHGGMCPSAKTGLSTLSLYNYLSTTFDDGQMTIYSNEKAASVYTKQQHYAVNTIGSGMLGVLFYLNCFGLMLVVAVMGVFYACGILISNLKHGLTIITQIPGAMLGVLGSMVQFLVIAISMIVELIGTYFAYFVLSELLMVFVTVLESPMATLFGTAQIGGLTAQVGVLASGFGDTAFGYFLNIGFGSLVCLFCSVLLLVKAPAFVAVSCKVREYLYLRFVLCDAMCHVYDVNEHTEDAVVAAEKPLSFFVRLQRTFLEVCQPESA